MRTERVLNWLTPRVYTERFQAIHLIVNYSLLVLACLLYLAGVVSVLAISLACLPGAACFLVSIECMAWKMLNEGDMSTMIDNLLSNMR